MLTEEQILKRYPAFVPLRGISADDADPKNHVRVENTKAHERINPEHYRAMLAETPSVAVTVQQSVDAALKREREERADDIEFAVAAERERCVKIAEAVGGKNAKQIVDRIRAAAVQSDNPAVPEEVDPFV